MATVVATPAANVLATSAHLRGYVNPEGVASYAWFEYGPTTGYGTETTHVYVGDGSADVDLDQVVFGLTPVSTYHYRVATEPGAGPPPPGPGTLYGSEDFDDDSIDSPWVPSQFFPTGTLAPVVVDDPLSERGKSLLLQADYAPGLPTNYTPPALQQTAISINPQYAHAGMDEFGVPVYTGMETWYRFALMTLAGNVFCNGESNWLTEWHDTTGGVGPKSSGMFAFGGYPLVAGGTTVAKLIHRETVDVGGGDYQNIYFPGGFVEDPISAAALAPAFTTDVWHDIVYHKIWDPDPALGLVEWWVDGTQYASQTLQTQATNDYYSWGFYNYRYNVTGTSGLYYDDILWGSTADAIGFTP